MVQITGFITLLLLASFMYAMYLRDKERFRIYKKVAIFDLLLALLNIAVYFIDK